MTRRRNSADWLKYEGYILYVDDRPRGVTKRPTAGLQYGLSLVPNPNPNANANPKSKIGISTVRSLPIMSFPITYGEHHSLSGRRRQEIPPPVRSPAAQPT